MIDIIYSGNDKYFNQIFLSSLSMAMHTKEALHIRIMTLDCETKKGKYYSITPKQVEFLDFVLKTYNKDSLATLIDMTMLYEKYIPKDGKNKNTVYTPYSILRLLCTHIEGLPSKIIYLDTDTMVYNDINELYSINLMDNEYAAVQDIVGRYFFGWNYCNSGILLLNLDRIKETKLFDKCIQYISTKRRFMPDQDALNYHKTKRIVLPRKFNEQRNVKDDTVVKHFCKIPKMFPFIHTVNIKQTNRDGVHNTLKIHEFDDVFKVYDELRKGHEDLLFN